MPSPFKEEVCLQKFCLCINSAQSFLLSLPHKTAPMENQIVIYQTDNGQTAIDVRLENETVWLTQAQMAELFQSDRTTIVRHINNIYKDEELEREATCAKIAQVHKEGKRMVKVLVNLINQKN